MLLDWSYPTDVFGKIEIFILINYNDQFHLTVCVYCIVGRKFSFYPRMKDFHIISSKVLYVWLLHLSSCAFKSTVDNTTQEAVGRFIFLSY